MSRLTCLVLALCVALLAPAIASAGSVHDFDRAGIFLVAGEDNDAPSTAGEDNDAPSSAGEDNDAPSSSGEDNDAPSSSDAVRQARSAIGVSLLSPSQTSQSRGVQVTSRTEWLSRDASSFKRLVGWWRWLLRGVQR